MTKRKAYLILQTIVCILLAVYLSLSAIALYREGSARKAADPREKIYTREIAAEKMASAAPLLLASLGLFLVGAVLGIKDEKDDTAVKARKSEKDSAHSRSVLASQEEQGVPQKQGKLQAVLAVAGVILIIAGVCNHSARDVLYKAITICSECIGLG